MKKMFLYFLLLSALMTGCSPLATVPARKVDAQKFGLGFVQNRIENGLSGQEVIDLLGPPNIIVSNEKGGESWIYDKISTEEESASFFSNEVKVKSSRSTIIVIQFDRDKKVSGKQYRQTSY